MSRTDTEHTNPNRIRTRYLVNLIIMGAVTLVAAGLAAFFMLRTGELTRQNSELSDRYEELRTSTQGSVSEKELQKQLMEARESAASLQKRQVLMQIQSSLESGSSTTAILRSLFEDSLVVQSGGRYYFYPIESAAAKNSFLDGDFAFDEGGALVYKGNSLSVHMERGVDVSENNGEIDWAILKDEEVGFAMISVGAAQDDGLILEDARFEENMQGAAEAGLDIGVCFRIGAASTEEAEMEAEYVISALEQHKAQIRCPVAVMLPSSERGERLLALSRFEWTEIVKAFCRRIQEEGYRPVIYGSLSSFTMQVDITELEPWDKWLANYDSRLYFPYKFSMWQYSVNGMVGGIEGETGMDVIITE